MFEGPDVLGDAALLPRQKVTILFNKGGNSSSHALPCNIADRFDTTSPSTRSRFATDNHEAVFVQRSPLANFETCWNDILKSFAMSLSGSPNRLLSMI